MTGPVILIDRDGWLAAFWTTDAAEHGIEPADVEDDEYVGVDAAGRRLAIAVRDGVPAAGNRAASSVVVSPVGGPVDELEVRRLLELALPAEQRAGDGPGRRSLIDCLSRIVLDDHADHVPPAATARLRSLLAVTSE